jgi:hypothetical protein
MSQEAVTRLRLRININVYEEVLCNSKAVKPMTT